MSLNRIQQYWFVCFTTVAWDNWTVTECPCIYRPPFVFFSGTWRGDYRIYILHNNARHRHPLCGEIIALDFSESEEEISGWVALLFLFSVAKKWVFSGIFWFYKNNSKKATFFFLIKKIEMFRGRARAQHKCKDLSDAPLRVFQRLKNVSHDAFILKNVQTNRE